MRKLIALVAALSLLAALPHASAAPGFKRLGTDPAGDGPAALDVTYLDVAAKGDKLEIRIGIDKMLPGTGGYPALPGIEWIFELGGRTFIAEAVADTSPDFYLFELKGDSYTQLQSPEGTYDWADGYASIIVPFDSIGARRGMTVSGVGKKGTEDVDAHVHLGPETYYPDKLATTKDYVIP